MVKWSEQPLRTLLFAPGNEPRKLAKVDTFGADAIVLDLEDAVAVGEKKEARRTVREALPRYRHGAVMVRVNALSTGLCFDDLDAVVCPHLDAIILPKVESAAMLQEVDERLSVLEQREGLPTGSIRQLLLIETALGLVRVEETALHVPRRVHTLIFGQGDFTTDLGIDLTADATELLYARSRVVVAARAAGLPQPIDGPYINLVDRKGLIQDSLRARQLGFQGRITIYPPQVEPINWAYSWMPEDDVAMARKIITAFEEAESSGSAAIQVEGRFVDYPIYRRALHKIRLYETSTAPVSEGELA
jgi:citrate lyase subunit beta / citryl-CoA lyase